MAAGGSFRSMRVLFLLAVLLVVATNTWLAKLRSTDWNEPLWLVVYPINGDGGAVTQAYIDSLTREDFSGIETFLTREGRRYALALEQPVSVRLAPSPAGRPPAPPAAGGVLNIMLWSLKLRYWAFSNDTFQGPAPDVQMFVVYYDPAQHERLAHSLGLQKGLIGVVNGFASRQLAPRNNVVIAHEFLHTLGASDKYQPATNLPSYPLGYAEPQRQPRYPQRRAEIMGGRIPVSAHEAVMPDSLSQCDIGPATALEIRWPG
jgi:hypothetical protein